MKFIVGRGLSKTNKPCAIGEYLQQIQTKIDLVKKREHAWEPMLNSMATERTLITIDGMRIFWRTDKMDPLPYVGI
jgi:iron complex outermembrane receptor protein